LGARVNAGRLFYDKREWIAFALLTATSLQAAGRYHSPTMDARIDE
jgi:hypothetical protein